MLGEPIGKSPEIPARIINHLDTAYDIGNCGIGTQLHAVSRLFHGEMDEDWVFDSVTETGSNFLVNERYILGTTGNPEDDEGSVFFSPRIPNHIRLSSRMRQRYKRLETDFMRMTMGGEVSLDGVENDEITRGEWNSLLLTAQSNGLLTLGQGLPDQVNIVTNPFQFSFMLKHIHEASINSVSFANAYESSQYAQRFRPAIQDAAIDKLGTMMGLVDQLTFEAAALGSPVSSEYRPLNKKMQVEKYWPEYFGEELPGIGRLYEQAHEVFTRVADPNDPYLGHILSMPTLSQLRRE